MYKIQRKVHNIVDIYVTNKNYSVEFLENNNKADNYSGTYIGTLKLVTIHGGHLLVRLCRTRSIGRPPDVENWTKTVLQASLTSVSVQFSPPREL